MSDKVSIRGTSDGLTITIGSGSWQVILTELAEKLSKRAAFFKGGRAVVTVGERLLGADQIEAVGKLLTDHQMTLWAIYSNAQETVETAQKLGLETQPSASAAPKPPTDEVDLTTKTVRRTLRSGQQVEHQGHVVVIGDVNPGARVAAGGHIIVWGKLRGTAHAGAVVPAEGFVCALELAPTQLIIGNVISRTPLDDSPNQVIPEMAFVQQGQIIAEAWGYDIGRR
jgi:septum site-determining protein MinC